MEEAPWGDWYGKPLSARTLGKLLHPFEIKSRTVRFSDGSTAKGLLRSQFEDAWKRYLGPKTSHGHNGSIKPETGAFDPSHDPRCDRYENGEKPHEQANVTDVTDTECPTGENGASDDRNVLVLDYTNRELAALGVAAWDDEEIA